jgi:hypothetical protein
MSSFVICRFVRVGVFTAAGVPRAGFGNPLGVPPSVVGRGFIEGSALGTRGHARGSSTSCSLLTRHHAQAPAVLDHSRTLPQGDGRAGPAFTRCAIGGECNLIVLDAGDVLHDAFAVRGPGIDAEGEVSSQTGHFRPFYPIPPLIHCAAAVYYRRRPWSCEAMYLSRL